MRIRIVDFLFTFICRFENCICSKNRILSNYIARCAMITANLILYCFTHLDFSKDLIPNCDFDILNIPNEPRDVYAGAVIASGLYELAQYDQVNSKVYTDRANTILKNITLHYGSKPGLNRRFFIVK